jgi:hypothetical protein
MRSQVFLSHSISNDAFLSQPALVVLELVQQTLSFVISDGEESGLWREIHTEYVIQWGLRSWPIREYRSGWHVKQFQTIRGEATGHGKNLAIVIEFQAIDDGWEIHDRANRFSTKRAGGCARIEIHHATLSSCGEKFIR